MKEHSLRSSPNTTAWLIAVFLILFIGYQIHSLLVCASVFKSYICPSRILACTRWHHAMTDLAFQIPQYPQTGRLPWSLIFLDMTSFIIHPSTAPLISSLSAPHSSRFCLHPLFFFSRYHSSFTAHTSAMSSLPATSPFLVRHSPASPSIVVGLVWFIESFSALPAPLIVYQREVICQEVMWFHLMPLPSD